jgi:hypothetical protein
MGNVRHIKIYRRYDDTKEWVADGFVSLNGHPQIHDCVPDLREDVKEVIEEHLPSVRGQIWLAGEIPISEETYGWVSEDVPEQSKERT